MRNTRSFNGASVRVDNLSKFYGDVAAVADISFEFAASEFVTLLGPSGSGKTTTLMMIAGFETPTAGEIFINDKPVASEPPRSRNLGMVFQNYALFPHMSVFDNVAFPLKMRNLPADEIKRAVGEALEVVNLVGYDARLPRQLSGGQQQRVAFARAIVFKPPVLLMDEPLGALDKNLRQRLQLEVKRIQRDLGVTVIYVTHDQEEALVMSDRIFLMNRGIVEQSGSPEDLYNRPRTAFVAGFLGETNFLETNVRATRDGMLDLTIGETLVRAPSTEDFPSGAGKLAIRPEKLWISSSAATDANCLPCTVTETIFVGDHLRLVAELPTGEKLAIKQQERFGSNHPDPGSRMMVCWHPQDGRVLSATPR